MYTDLFGIYNNNTGIIKRPKRCQEKNEPNIFIHLLTEAVPRHSKTRGVGHVRETSLNSCCCCCC